MPLVILFFDKLGDFPHPHSMGQKRRTAGSEEPYVHMVLYIGTGRGQRSLRSTTPFTRQSEVRDQAVGTASRLMLCHDTSSLIAYLQGHDGADVDFVDQAFIDQVGVLSPVTVAELLSDPNLSPTLRRTILELPTFPITEGFWERTGLL